MAGCTCSGWSRRASASRSAGAGNGWRSPKGGCGLTRLCEQLQPRQITQGVRRACTAHLGRGLQPLAYGRARSLAKEQAAGVVAQLHAAHTGGFAVRHAGNGAGDRRRRAAGPAAGSADDGCYPNHSCQRLLVGRWQPISFKFCRFMRWPHPAGAAQPTAPAPLRRARRPGAQGSAVRRWLRQTHWPHR